MTSLITQDGKIELRMAHDATRCLLTCDCCYFYDTSVSVGDFVECPKHHKQSRVIATSSAMIPAQVIDHSTGAVKTLDNKPVELKPEVVKWRNTKHRARLLKGLNKTQEQVNKGLIKYEDRKDTDASKAKRMFNGVMGIVRANINAEAQT